MIVITSFFLLPLNGSMGDGVIICVCCFFKALNDLDDGDVFELTRHLFEEERQALKSKPTTSAGGAKKAISIPVGNILNELGAEDLDDVGKSHLEKFAKHLVANCDNQKKV